MLPNAHWGKNLRNLQEYSKTSTKRVEQICSAILDRNKTIEPKEYQEYADRAYNFWKVYLQPSGGSSYKPWYQGCDIEAPGGWKDGYS